MTSNANKAMIDEEAAYIAEMERRGATPTPHRAHVYRSDTFEPEGHLVPTPEDVYTLVEKTGALKFCVDKFAQWAEDMSGERFVSCDQGTTHYIYKDGVYADGVSAWFKTAMNLCNRNSDVTIHYTREVLNRLGANTMIDAGVTDGQDTNLTVLNNCILNTKTCEITDHTPDHIAFSKLSCDYVKGATCPEWMEFIEFALSDADQETMQEMFGCCLTRSYKYQVAFFLLGTGRNGKGASMEILKAMLGDGNHSAAVLQDIGERFNASSLYKKYANITGDTSPRALHDTSMYKMLTGGDTIRAEDKGKDAYNFKNHAKIISQMNELMKTSDQSDGFFERFVLCSFDNRPTQERVKAKDGFESRIIANELPGVLNWAIEGLKRLHKRHGFSYTLDNSPAQKRNDWGVRADHVQGFVEACCDTGVGPKRYIATQTFMSAYRRWHEDKYCLPPKESQGDITKTAPWTGFQKPNTARVRSEDMGVWLQDDGRDKTHISVYKGICLKNTSGLSDVDEMYLADHWDEIVGNAPVAAIPTDAGKGEVVRDVSAGSEIMRMVGEKMESYGGAETIDKFAAISTELKKSGYDDVLVLECITRYKQGHRIYGRGE